MIAKSVKDPILKTNDFKKILEKEVDLLQNKNSFKLFMTSPCAGEQYNARYFIISIVLPVKGLCNLGHEWLHCGHEHLSIKCC